MGILKKHLQKTVRYQEEDLIVYEPKQIHTNKLKKMLEESLTISNKFSVKGGVEVDVFIYMIKNLTNIGDEIDEFTEDEIIDLINGGIDNNGDRALKNVMSELINVIYEIIKDMQSQQHLELESIITAFDMAESNKKIKSIEDKIKIKK